MAVYTTLTEPEICALLSGFDLPGLAAFQGANSGIENTTYFLTLESGARYVLTVFENISFESLRPYIELTTCLHHQKLPVPCPLIDKSGVALQTIAGKPALLFVRAPGSHVASVGPAICQQVGGTLARIHRAAPKTEIFSFSPSSHGLPSMRETFAFVKDSLDKPDTELLERQLDLSADLLRRNLPQGIIHGDLFRDNVLVENHTITAVIDFYNAGSDIFLIDLAITANDWCFMQRDYPIADCVSALLAGYQMVQPLTEIERDSWRDCLCVAASRLWLSRQKRILMSRHGQPKTVKDPGEYRSLLLYHLNNL